MTSISALTTCVNYSDFLVWFLLFNKNQFNRLVVLTTPEDEKTKTVCDFFNVECLPTEVFYTNGQTFGKSQAINVGIQHLLNTSADPQWLCHIDSDILLPPRAMSFIKAHDLKKDSIYTIDRLRVQDFKTWSNFLLNPQVFYEQEVWLRLDRFPIMPRVYKEDNILPIGYFQLWHIDADKNTYPEIHENAARSDMLFAKQWAPNKRKLIPTAIGLHIESEEASMGTNWNGRKTGLFTYAPEPVSFQIESKVNEVIEQLTNTVKFELNKIFKI